MEVTKRNENGKFAYYLNGKLCRRSKRNYLWACVATTRLAKGAASEGKEFIISLGRNSRTTLSSMAKLYGHCDLTAVIIKDE